jgi:uncharacterized UBP type Zn finger protein
MAKCEHVKSANSKVPPRTEGCEECMKTGQSWVALRKCLTCGHVGCCDSSPGRHANRHFNESGHPVMQAHDGGDWKWCYVDRAYV